MAKHLNPLEKEFLIKRYKSNMTIKLRDFCINNDISITAFKKWIKQYEEDLQEQIAQYQTYYQKESTEQKNHIKKK